MHLHEPHQCLDFDSRLTVVFVDAFFDGITTVTAQQPWLSSYPDHAPWDTKFSGRPVFALLDDSVAKFPSHQSMDFLGKTYTYGELGTLVARAAAGFRKLGVDKGVRVGLFLPNCPQFVIAYFGVLKAGGTVVNYSPLYSEEELLHQIEDSGTTIMVTLSLKALYPKMAAALQKGAIAQLVVGALQDALPFPKSLLFSLFKRGDVVAIPDDDQHIAFSDLLATGDPCPDPVINPEEDVAVLQYTGGTTGVSKGAMLTHANIYINIQQALLWNQDVQLGQERMMGVLPFFHVFAMAVVMGLTLAVGGSIIMHPRFELDAVLKDITKKKPTLFPGVPTMYMAIISHPKIGSFDLTSIKTCMAGGAPLPLEIKQRFEKLSGCTLVEGYGLTECSPMATVNPIGAPGKDGSVGMPIPGTTITIVDKENPMKVLPQGETGEICISGPQVMKGYWGREQATAETIVDGRLRTGDVGYLDEDGYLFIIDRMKDLILVSGFNVFPRNVEEGIYRHLAVDEVTVIGIPDDYTGEVVKAFIKLKADHSLGADELRTFLADKLGRHEMPKHVEFRDELPKTMIGKLSKKELVAEEKARRA